jgi:chromosomal replication initiator protein
MEQGFGGVRVTEPRPGGPEPILLAWDHVHSAASPELRRWLITTKPLNLHQDALMVAAPNNFTRTLLEGRFRGTIEEHLTDFFERPVQLAVIVDDSLAPAGQAGDSTAGLADFFDAGSGSARFEHNGRGDFGSESGQSRQGFGSRSEYTSNGDSSPHPEQVEVGGFTGDGRSSYDETRPRREPDARLNPKYTFETFVIGSSNRFAHAAAIAVAESPGKSYNPLTIYGDSGLGKTHLLHALGHYVRNYLDRVRVRYVSTEELTNDFINAISQNKGVEFRRRYRDVDVLLIDDIQFLEGKEQTQEEFFHTFNTLHNAQKQIVMTSDRPPKLLEHLEPRLRSRFGWGLITDVQPPDLETRIAILRKKAAQERLVAGPEVLEFIASRIQTNIRELEGALIRVTAFASLNRQQVDLSLAEIVLRDLIPEGGETQITVGSIMAQTADYFTLTIDDLCGQSRTHQLVTARQIAMYLCRELTDMSLPKIGQQFGGRDHTTVMHAERKIRTLMSERRSVYNQVTELTNRIKQQAAQRH